jgi:hypothetical protein
MAETHNCADPGSNHSNPGPSPITNPSAHTDPGDADDLEGNAILRTIPVTLYASRGI